MGISHSTPHWGRCAALLALGLAACSGGAKSAEPAAAPSSSGGSSDPQAALANYAGTIYGCVMERFSVTAAQWSGLKVHLQIRVAPDGTMAPPVVSRPSSDPDFDAAVTAAAEACRNLPPPPPEVAPRLEAEGLQIVFESPG